MMMLQGIIRKKRFHSKKTSKCCFPGCIYNFELNLIVEKVAREYYTIRVKMKLMLVQW